METPKKVFFSVTDQKQQSYKQNKYWVTFCTYFIFEEMFPAPYLMLIFTESTRDKVKYKQ